MKDSTPLTDRFVNASWIVIPLAFGFLSLSYGQDANWDLRNYHWYNPYAFLNHRLGIDLGAAHNATFYNPIVDLPLFLLAHLLPARAVGFVLGVVHGLNYVALYALSRATLADAAPLWPRLSLNAVCALVALIGVTGGGHLGLVGTTFNDNLVSLLLLGAAIVLARRPELWRAEHESLSRSVLSAVLTAGSMVGLAVGLKLPTAPFAVGFCAGFFCVGGSFSRRALLAFIFGLAVVAGFALAGGPWMWMLWRDYANPLFPYFNTIFKSPLGMAQDYRDTRFLPEGPFGWFAFPVVFSLDPKKVGEVAFQDFRILAAYCVLLGTMVCGVLRPSVRAAIPHPLKYLISVAAITYVAWIAVFGIYRYIVPLEMLAPLLIAGAISAWPLRLKGAGAAALFATLLLTARPADWLRQPWRTGPFVHVVPPPVENPGQALAIITGTDPVAWVIPAFPPEIPFLRIFGYLAMPEHTENGLNKRARAIIDAHRGAFYLLFPQNEQSNAESSLAAYGLTPDFESCRAVESNLGDYVRWCRVYRSDTSAAAPT